MDFLKGIFTKVRTDSAKGTLNKKDAQYVIQHALLVGAAAAVGVLIQNVGLVDLGQYGPMLVPVISMGLVSIKNWLTDNTKEE